MTTKTKTSSATTEPTTEPTEAELLLAARRHLLHAAIKASRAGDQGASTFVYAYCALCVPTIPA